MSNAAAINAAAKDLATRGLGHLGTEKVWVQDIVGALLAQNPGWTAAEVKAAVWEARNEVVLGSVDLIDAYDPAKIRESRLSFAGDQHWCFVYAL